MMSQKQLQIYDRDVNLKNELVIHVFSGDFLPSMLFFVWTLF